MSTPTDDSGKSADDRSMAERVIDKVTGRDHDREIDERAAAAARQDAEDRANLADDDVRADDLSQDDRVGGGVATDVDPDRTGVFRPTTPVPSAPGEPVGGEVTGEDVPAPPADRARPAWPGPSAASSVGQAATPGPEKDAADRDRAAWAGPTVAGSRSDGGSSGSTDSGASSDVYPGRTAGSDPYPGGDAAGSDAGASSDRDVNSDVGSVSGVGPGRNLGSDLDSDSDVYPGRTAGSDVYTAGTAEPVSGAGSGRNLDSDSDSDVYPGRTGAVSGVGAGRSTDPGEYRDGPQTGSGRGLGRSAGSDDYSSADAGVGSSVYTSEDAASDRGMYSDPSADSDQASRAIPTGTPVTAPAPSSTSTTSGTSTIAPTYEAPVTSGSSTTSDASSISGVPIPSAASAASGTSDDGIYRSGDPSVREDYVHADADRRATGAQFDDEDTKNDEDARDGVDTKDRAGTRESADSDHGVDGVDVTAPAPVTSITGGRRRSEAAPDAVHGVTDVTPDSEWRELQANFVDDPAATVAEAATLIERDLAGLRSKLAGGDTEHLRNAFKRYRSLHESLR